MKILYLFIISLVVIGLIFKKNNIKDIKFYKISIITIMVIVYISVLIIVEFVVPIPTYYIKAKDSYGYIEDVIQEEMIKSNIDHDKASLKVVNQFIGKYNQLYLSSYEVNGEEEARMFDFKVNIFGNLKPSHEFSESKVILKEELDDGSNYRIITDGMSAFYIRYGYANNPEQFKNRGVGEFVVRSINPEGYYMLARRNDDWSPFGWELIIWAIGLLIIRLKEKKKLSYSETKFFGKKKFPFEIEYYI